MAIVMLLPPWYARAACGGNPAPFFGPEDEDELARLRRENEAKAICAGCPVRDQCEMSATSRPEKWGVWGGDTEDERRNRRRRDRRQPRRSA